MDAVCKYKHTALRSPLEGKWHIFSVPCSASFVDLYFPTQKHSWCFLKWLSRVFLNVTRYLTGFLLDLRVASKSSAAMNQWRTTAPLFNVCAGAARAPNEATESKGSFWISNNSAILNSLTSMWIFSGINKLSFTCNLRISFLSSKNQRN